MTIQSIRNQLIHHFCEDDTFTMASQDAIWVEKEVVDKKVALIKEGLADLIEMGIIRAAGPDFWVLNRDMHEVVMPMNVSVQTRLAITSVIETWHDAHDIDFDLLDPLSITEREIHALLGMINDMLDDMTGGPGPQGGPPPGVPRLSPPSDPSRN